MQSGPGAPKPGKRGRRKTLVVASAAVATLLIAGAVAVVLHHGEGRCEGKRTLASVEKGLVLSPVKVTKATPEDLCEAGTSLTFTASGKDELRVVFEDPDSFSDETMTQTFTRLN